MKIIATIMIALLTNIQANELSPQELLKMCYEDCVAFETPGFALRKCLAECKEDHEEDTQLINKFCETYEDCDDDGDVWGGL